MGSILFVPWLHLQHTYVLTKETSFKKHVKSMHSISTMKRMHCGIIILFESKHIVVSHEAKERLTHISILREQEH